MDEYEKFEEELADPAKRDGWFLSMRACAASTSYEDYLARLAGEAGQN